MGIHDGHRDRLRQRFLSEGLDSFEDINMLELLLFYAIPRRDTNDLAHRLLSQFGSLIGVLSARPEDLRRVPGMTENAAILLHLIWEFDRRKLIARADTQIVSSTQEAGDFLMPYFYGLRNEVLYILCLDAKGKVLCCRELTEGSLNAAVISIRKIVEVALASNASNVVIAHNHPGGLAIPSPEDEAVTRQIWTALRSVDITLLDHLIIAEDDFVSLADSGLFRRFQMEHG